MTTPTEARYNPGQGDQEHLVKDSLSCIATRGDVIERTREFNAERTSHGCSLLGRCHITRCDPNAFAPLKG